MSISNGFILSAGNSYLTAIKKQITLLQKEARKDHLSSETVVKLLKQFDCLNEMVGNLVNRCTQNSPTIAFRLAALETAIMRAGLTLGRHLPFHKTLACLHNQDKNIEEIQDAYRKDHQIAIERRYKLEERGALQQNEFQAQRSQSLARCEAITAKLADLHKKKQALPVRVLPPPCLPPDPKTIVPARRIMADFNRLCEVGSSLRTKAQDLLNNSVVGTDKARLELSQQLAAFNANILQLEPLVLKAEREISDYQKQERDYVFFQLDRIDIEFSSELDLLQEEEHHLTKQLQHEQSQLATLEASFAKILTAWEEDVLANELELQSLTHIYPKRIEMMRTRRDELAVELKSHELPLLPVRTKEAADAHTRLVKERMALHVEIAKIERIINGIKAGIVDSPRSSQEQRAHDEAHAEIEELTICLEDLRDQERNLTKIFTSLTQERLLDYKRKVRNFLVIRRVSLIDHDALINSAASAKTAEEYRHAARIYIMKNGLRDCRDV